jgi:hypothetical protein
MAPAGRRVPFCVRLDPIVATWLQAEASAKSEGITAIIEWAIRAQMEDD